MATEWKHVMTNGTWLYVLFCFLALQGCEFGQVWAYDYQDDIQSLLCAAQCEAFCLDTKNPDSCALCNTTVHWITNCDEPYCYGTCSVLRTNYDSHKNQVVRIPVVNVRALPDGQSMELMWSRPELIISSSPMSMYNIIYIIERTQADPRYPGISTTQLKGWVTDTRYEVALTGHCSQVRYRVMAINQFGSSGFSNPVYAPSLSPGPVQNIHLTGKGIYYYEDKNNTAFSEFMTVLKWDNPVGWDDRDIDHYEWNQMMNRSCEYISHDSLPILKKMINQSNHILMTISSVSIGCKFLAQVRAVSKCNTKGPWANLLVDLTNCSSINGYMCQDKPFDPPGKVGNVTLSVTSKTEDEVMNYLLYPNLKLTSPLHVFLHVHWRPPLDLGSHGYVDHYIVRSGKAERQLFPIPPEFIGMPASKKAPNDTVEMIFEVETYSIPYTFGVQVIAVGPSQTITDNQWGLFPMHTMEVSRNDSAIMHFMKEGQVLLDQAGIVIIYVKNTMPVHFVFDDSPMGRVGNTTVDRFAMQWGPLVGPEGNRTITVENGTVIARNQSRLSVKLQQTSRTYGLRVTYLSDEAEEESREDFYVFTLPEGAQIKEPDSISQEENEKTRLTPVYASVGVLLCVVTILSITWFLVHRRRGYKHLERRLLEGLEEIDEDGEHYFIMRPANTRNEESPPPTVVADRWELPHTCLKAGRLLGSGAFGQVVKGRVSKSLLAHRGIDLTAGLPNSGTHVTVAIKVMHENTEDRYVEDFLREINMMKDLGYHSNIVSLLGCCTLREPFCLVVEHLAHGDLLSYLQKLRQEIVQRDVRMEGYINEDLDLFTPTDLLSVARQIARGMEYLSQKGFVHRDLAARNVLVGENKMVKIGDFGLARYIYNDSNKIYVHRRGGKLPLRWMAPESIFDRIFSTASDVWSFGIVLYEIVTLGCVPYPGLNHTQLQNALKLGTRMERPDNCSQEIYDIMLLCWEQVLLERPSFTDLCVTFTSMLEEATELEYFNFKVSDIKDYYSIDSDEMDESDLDMPSAGCLYNHIASLQNAEAEVVTRIPDENIEITDIQKLEILTCPSDYSESMFARNLPSTSSFHNELYAVKKDDVIEGIPDSTNREKLTEMTWQTLDTTSKGLTNIENEFDNCQSSMANGHSSVNLKKEFQEKVSYTELASSVSLVVSRSRSCSGSGSISDNNGGDDDNSVFHGHLAPEYRVSSSSDEVFSECTSCSISDDLIDKTVQEKCKKCCKLMVSRRCQPEIHVTERNDSAFSSTASDDSDQSHSNHSESSVATSDEYLMPDSPCEATDIRRKEVSFDTLCDIPTNMSSHKPKHFVFEPHPLKKTKLHKIKSVENPCYTWFHQMEAYEIATNLADRRIDEMLSEFVSMSENMTIATTYF
ncbi:uncharacterized protein LOC128207991 isoform X2 [Mya arenaria]|uniref:uncharacterized protein LOC128207991 isoform X2 n=1 Tax=Mya arenaria TaxID=6604 RepID=UPI0022E71FF3|nr:uncharacterized protein LOC128207991 isoform X2 [Mya arenaria]